MIVVGADGPDLGNGLGVLPRVMEGEGDRTSLIPEDHTDLLATRLPSKHVPLIVAW